MSEESPLDRESTKVQKPLLTSGFGVAICLAGIAAVGAGIAIQQVYERRLSKPERARLKFYRYLREKGHLES